MNTNNPVVHLIHGIHAEEKGGSPRRLVPYLEAVGLPVKVRSYGKLKWWQARFANEKLAACFADSIAPGDLLVTHSNGGALAWLMAEMGAPIGGVLAIQPALDADCKWASQVGWVDIIANRDDVWVGVSTLLLGHMWGSLGRDGYTGPTDSRVTTIFTDERRPDNQPEALGHTDILTEEMLTAWGPWFANRILSHRGE